MAHMHKPSTTAPLPVWTECLLGCGFLAAIDTQFGNFSGDGIAPDTQRLRGLDTPAPGVSQGTGNQDAFEDLNQDTMHIRHATRQ